MPLGATLTPRDVSAVAVDGVEGHRRATPVRRLISVDLVGVGRRRALGHQVHGAEGQPGLEGGGLEGAVEGGRRGRGELGHGAVEHDVAVGVGADLDAVPSRKSSGIFGWPPIVA